MNTLETERLILCHPAPDDAEFMLSLLNTPGWLKFIGDRNVKTLKDAENYITEKIVKCYEEHGFCPYVVKLKNNNVPVGICGLIKRETLDDIDIGFALLPEHAGKGYAFESAAEVLSHAKINLGIIRIVAITNEENTDSKKLLEKLGLKFEKTICFPNDKKPLLLYANN